MMEVYQDLYIRVTAEQMAALIADVEKALPADWKRDYDAEKQARTATVVTPGSIYCFACTQKDDREAAVLSLVEKEPGLFYVSNIVPIEYRKLSYAQYNAILNDFYLQVFKQIPVTKELTHELTSERANLERWMSRDTALLLNRFSGLANKNSAASHPKDEERWYAFIVAAHKENSQLDSSTLGRWLMEKEQWPEDAAYRLASDYERQRELLRYAASTNGI